jgi:hypothetical protein
MKGIGKEQILQFLKDNFDTDVKQKSKLIDKALTNLITPSKPEAVDAKVILENDLYRYD